VPQPERAKNPSQRDQVREAIAALRAGTSPRPDLADAVDKFFTAVTSPRQSETVPMYLPKETWRRAEEKATQEGRKRANVIEEGYTEFLAGRWLPTRWPRGRVTDAEAGPRITASIRVKTDRLRELEEYAAANPALIGWEPSPAQVAAAWIKQYVDAEPVAPRSKSRQASRPGKSQAE
jgi:hypothetical protein